MHGLGFEGKSQLQLRVVSRWKVEVEGEADLMDGAGA